MIEVSKSSPLIYTLLVRLYQWRRSCQLFRGLFQQKVFHIKLFAMSSVDYRVDYLQCVLYGKENVLFGSNWTCLRFLKQASWWHSNMLLEYLKSGSLPNTTHHIPVHFKPSNTLKQKLIHPKDKTTTYKQYWGMHKLVNCKNKISASQMHGKTQKTQQSTCIWWRWNIPLKTAMYTFCSEKTDITWQNITLQSVH